MGRAGRKEIDNAASNRVIAAVNRLGQPVIPQPFEQLDEAIAVENVAAGDSSGFLAENIGGI